MLVLGKHTLNGVTPRESAAAVLIILSAGGVRELVILENDHTFTKGKTWNKDHKVIYVTFTEPDKDGHRNGCAVDIVTNSICG